MASVFEPGAVFHVERRSGRVTPSGGPSVPIGGGTRSAKACSTWNRGGTGGGGRTRFPVGRVPRGTRAGQGEGAVSVGRGHVERRPGRVPRGTRAGREAGREGSTRVPPWGGTRLGRGRAVCLFVGRVPCGTPARARGLGRRARCSSPRERGSSRSKACSTWNSRRGRAGRWPTGGGVFHVERGLPVGVSRCPSAGPEPERRGIPDVHARERLEGFSLRPGERVPEEDQVGPGLPAERGELPRLSRAEQRPRGQGVLQAPRTPGSLGAGDAAALRDRSDQGASSSRASGSGSFAEKSPATTTRLPASRSRPRAAWGAPPGPGAFHVEHGPPVGPGPGMSGRRARFLIRSWTGSAADLMDQYESGTCLPRRAPGYCPGRRKDGPRGSNHLYLQSEGRRR